MKPVTGDDSQVVEYAGQACELQPVPRHLGGVPQVWGEAGAPAFTPDGRYAWGEELRVPLPAGGAVTSRGYAGD